MYDQVGSREYATKLLAIFINLLRYIKSGWYSQSDLAIKLRNLSDHLIAAKGKGSTEEDVIIDALTAMIGPIQDLMKQQEEQQTDDLLPALRTQVKALLDKLFELATEW